MIVDKLPKFAEERVKRANLCIDLITAAPIKLPSKNIPYWRVPIIANKKRNALVDYANRQGFMITSHYRSLSGFITKTETPHANKLEKKIINVFNCPDTSFDYIYGVTDLINRFYETG